MLFAAIVVLTNLLGSVKIDSVGARIVSYVPAGGSETVFCSAAKIPEGECVEVFNGGVPICWPWVYDDWGRRRSIHGFAYRMPWRQIESQSPDTCIFILESSPETRKEWPHDFRLVYKIRLGNMLECSLKTENTGVSAFSFTEALHPYFAVGDLDRVKVLGLGDKAIQCREHVKGVFENAVGRTALTEIEDSSLSRRISVSSQGAARTVVWNRGKMPRSGYKEGDWRRFVCVEPANNLAEDAITLEPGRSHELKFAVSVK
jgi:glucose-6-phosphate 1-epimerase